MIFQELCIQKFTCDINKLQTRDRHKKKFGRHPEIFKLRWFPSFRDCAWIRQPHRTFDLVLGLDKENTAH